MLLHQSPGRARGVHHSPNRQPALPPACSEARPGEDLEKAVPVPMNDTEGTRSIRAAGRPGLDGASATTATSFINPAQTSRWSNRAAPATANVTDVVAAQAGLGREMSAGLPPGPLPADDDGEPRQPARVGSPSDRCLCAETPLRDDR